MMKTTKITFLLEKLFPKTMHKYWWKSRDVGITYGINQVLFLLDLEMKRLHKNADIPLVRLKAKEEAKYLMHLIAEIRKFRDAHKGN